MNWTHSSKGAALLAVVVVAAAIAVPAMAVSVEKKDVPSDATVGEKITASYTLVEPFQNPQYNSWKLTAETGLRNVTWTIEYYDQTGSQIESFQVDGQTIGPANTSPISTNRDQAIDKVVVKVTGDVPAIGQGNYTYPDEEKFLVASLTQSREGGTSNQIGSWSAVHYTEKSRQARTALDEAKQAIDSAESAGVSVEEANSDFESAKSAYEAGNFENAINLATDAKETAKSAQQSAESQSQMMQYALIGVGVLVLLALIGGAFYVYRQRQQQDTRLR